MALAPLATVADLLALNIDTTDAALTDSLLVSVSASVREAAGAPITRTTSTVTLPGSWEQFLPLPGAPVRAVESVTLDGAAVTDHKLRDGRLWRAAGWTGQHADVEVTYDHGYDEVPADLVRMVCTFVAAGIHASKEGLAEHRGVAYERGDDYQVGYQQGSDEVVDPTEIPQRTRDALRARFCGAAYVTGSY